MADLSPELLAEAKALNIDFTDIEEKFQVNVPNPFDSFVVVDNLPVIPLSKREKLITVIKKIFSSAGKVVGVTMPEENESTQGFCFIEFSNPEMARAAIKVGNGYKLDVKHTLIVNPFNDIEEYTHMPDEYVPPTIEEYQEKEHIKGWLKDQSARDQWVLLKGSDFGIYWNNKGNQPTLVHAKPDWSDLFVTWSPLGSYIATYHKQGIVIWGGDSFQKLERFSHPFVTGLCFSPKENYLITFSLQPFTSPEGEKHNFIVWDIATGHQLRSFKLYGNFELNNIDEAYGVVKTFKFSNDDKYVVRMVGERKSNGKTLPAGLQIYETPSMNLVNKKTLRVDNIGGFEWSPSKNIISYWTPQSENIPGRISIVDPVTQNIIRTQNMLQMVNCLLFWSTKGDYLLSSIERDKGKKGKRVISTGFQIFHVNEKDIPVDIVELGVDVPVVNVAWEPNSSRYAYIAIENGTYKGYFYDVCLPINQKKSANNLGPFKLGETEFKRAMSVVTWSPAGRFCVFAGLTHQGDIQFWDVDEIQLLTQADHSYMTDISWDPTGRYLTTSVSKWKAPTENGFMMWTTTGEILTKQMIPDYKILLWRPRAESLLTEEEKVNALKNLKEYSKQFDAEDEARGQLLSQDLLNKRIEILKKWAKFIEEKKSLYNSRIEERTRVCGYNIDAEGEIVDVRKDWIEELIEQKKEILN